MSTLEQHLTEYLTMRRALGYDLDKLEHLAGQFCTWLTAQGKETTFTTADALTWARLPADADPRWWGMRLGAVRTFAKYLDAIGVDVQVPPAGILPAGPRRAAPFIYSQADLQALLHACPQVFTRPLQAATMRTVIALLAATGMRIGEALRLTSGDINTAAEVEFARQAAAEVWGEENANANYTPSMGGEDFSFMLQKRPGCYAVIGQGPASLGKDIVPLHNTRYDFCDAIIPNGVRYFSRLVERGLPL